MTLENKNIIITGASDGIGKQIAIKLSCEKPNLFLLGRSTKKLDETKNKCREKGSNTVKIFPFDLTDNLALDNFVTEINQEEVDILINCAGIWQKRDETENISDNEIIKIINTNLTSQILLTKKILPNLKKQEEAAIINIVSKSGIVAQKGQSVYSASKWGMRGFTDVLRTDLKETKIRVGAVYQSGTNTKMFEKTGEDMPIEKFTDPADLADTVLFMLSRPEKIWLNEVHVNY